MKTNHSFFIILFLLVPYFVKSQSVESQYERRSQWLTNIPSIAQAGSTSCWAASIEMVLMPYNNYSFTQKKDDNVIKFRGLFDTLKTNLRFTGFDISTTMESSGINIIKGKNFNGSVTKSDSLPWNQLKENFEINHSPILYWKKFGPDKGTYHVNVFKGYEHTRFQQKQMHLIYVNDPWPYSDETIAGGANYIMTYEFYKKKPVSLKYLRPATIPNNEDTPNLALIYNFKLGIIKPDIQVSNSPSWDNNNNSSINIVTKFFKRETNKHILDQSNKTLEHLKNTASDNLLHYTNIDKIKTQIDRNSILKIIYFYWAGDNVGDSLKKTTKDSTEMYFDKYKIFDGYTTLFEDESTYLITLKTDNIPTAVISMEATEKKELYTTRIEKFNTSIAAVIADVVKNSVNNPNLPKSINAIKTAYCHRSYNEKFDFVILEQHEQRKPPILIDLYKKMELLNQPTKDSIQIHDFNFRVRVLNEENIKKMRVHFTTTAKPCGANCKYKITEAGMSMIEACQKLISKSDSTASYIQDDGSIYLTCRNFKMPANYLYSDLRKNGLISILANYAPTTEGKDSYFNFQWVGDYSKSSYDNFKLHNCSTCLPKPPMNYPYPSGSENAVYELIFVPIQSYKTLRNNEHTNTYPNWKRLKDIAIRPDDMKSIENPRLESSDGYFSVSEGEQKYLAQYKADLPTYPIKGILSSKGIICDVILKNSNKKIQCYLLNDYDSSLLWQEEK